MGDLFGMGLFFRVFHSIMFRSQNIVLSEVGSQILSCCNLRISDEIFVEPLKYQ